MITLMTVLLTAPIASSLIQPVVDSLINAISGKVVMRPEKRWETEFLPLLTLPLMIKAMTWKGITRAGKRLTIWIKRIKIFSCAPSFKEYWDY